MKGVGCERETGVIGNSLRVKVWHPGTDSCKLDPATQGLNHCRIYWGALGLCISVGLSLILGCHWGSTLYRRLSHNHDFFVRRAGRTCLAANYLWSVRLMCKESDWFACNGKFGINSACHSGMLHGKNDLPEVTLNKSIQKKPPQNTSFFIVWTRPNCVESKYRDKLPFEASSGFKTNFNQP